MSVAVDQVVNAADDERIRERAQQAIERAGYTVHTIYRIYPPLDTHCEQTVLFKGRDRSRYSARHEPFTAYVADHDDAVATIGVGW